MVRLHDNGLLQQILSLCHELDRGMITLDEFRKQLSSQALNWYRELPKEVK